MERAYDEPFDGVRVHDLGVGQTAKAAILELRAMPQTDITLLPAVADRLFLYSYLANRGGPEKYGQATIPF